MAIVDGVCAEIAARPVGTKRRRLIVAVLAVQFLIPLAALIGSGAPTRLGFQMYSGQGELTVEVVDEGGTAREIDETKLLSGARLEIDWVKNLPGDYACGKFPDAVSIVVTQSDTRGTKTATHAC